MFKVFSLNYSDCGFFFFQVAPWRLDDQGTVLIDGREVSVEDLPIVPTQDEVPNPPPKPGYPVPTLNGTPNPPRKCGLALIAP